MKRKWCGCERSRAGRFSRFKIAGGDARKGKRSRTLALASLSRAPQCALWSLGSVDSGTGSSSSSARAGENNEEPPGREHVGLQPVARMSASDLRVVLLERVRILFFADRIEARVMVREVPSSMRSQISSSCGCDMERPDESHKKLSEVCVSLNSSKLEKKTAERHTCHSMALRFSWLGYRVSSSPL